MNKTSINSNTLLNEHIESLAKERRILLALGDDITRIREKDDLLRFFSSRIRELYPFSHTIVTLIKQEAQTYAAFLLDHASSAIKDHSRYPEMVAGHFSLNEPFIQTVLSNNAPTAFILEDIMDAPESPSYLRVNYEGGIREILMTPLRNREQTFGFLHMYSKDTVSFTPEFKQIIGNLEHLIERSILLCKGGFKRNTGTDGTRAHHWRIEKMQRQNIRCRRGRRNIGDTWNHIAFQNEKAGHFKGRLFYEVAIFRQRRNNSLNTVKLKPVPVS